MIYSSRGGRRVSELGATIVMVVSLLHGACATMPPDEIGGEELSLCAGIYPSEAREMARDWVNEQYHGKYMPFEWDDLYEGTAYFWMRDGEFIGLHEDPERPNVKLVKTAGCILICQAWPLEQFLAGNVEREFIFLFRQGGLVSARIIDLCVWHGI